MQKFIDFINEAKIADIKVGTGVLMHGKIDTGRYYKINIEGITATVAKIEKGYYMKNITFDLDKSVDGRKKLTLNSYQLRNLDIIDDKEYEEFKRKIDAGEITKFKSSKDIKSVFKNIKFKKEGEYFNFTDLDLVKDKPDMISFIPAKKIKEKDKEKFRQTSKAGRIMKRLNPDVSEKDLEEFVNKFKAEVEILLKEPKINVLTGKDISYWYNQKHYRKGGGTLNKSCMRYASENKRIEFFDQYPEQIALATVIKGDELWARALIWKLDDGRTYMDRIYSVGEQYRIMLENYAKNHNMLMYGKMGSVKKGAVTVTLKNGWDWSEDFPYFDSFYENIKKYDDLVLKMY